MNCITCRWQNVGALIAGAIAILSCAMIGSCGEDTTSPKYHRGNSFLSLLVNTAPGMSFLGIDTSMIDGLMFSEIYYETDDRAGNDTITTHWAGFGDGNDAVMLASAQAAGLDIIGDGMSNIVQGRENREAIIPGSYVHWNVRYRSGMTFNDSILLPQRFSITNILPYSDQSAAQGIIIKTMNAVPGGDAVVTMRYEPARTMFAGGDTSGVAGATTLPTLSLHLVVDDNGTLRIPPTELQSMPKDKVYMLLVHRFRYETRPIAAGSRAGMIAVVTEMIPVFLRS